MAAVTVEKKKETISMRHALCFFSLLFLFFFFIPDIRAQDDTYQRVIALAKEDCGKIAVQLGEEVSSVTVGGVGIDTYSGNCSFSSEGFPGYASQLIEDIQITVNLVSFARYHTPESARNSLRKTIKYYETKQKANTADNDFESIVRETSDGYVYLLKGYLLAVWPELRKTHTAVVGITRGSCVIAVTGRSLYKDIGRYHTSGYPDTKRTINNHPGFNHDREAEILGLTRQKAEEFLNVLDCGNSPTVTPQSVQPNDKDSARPVSYPACAWDCTDQSEAKYKCPVKVLLDSCTTDKLSYQWACQNTCWDSWRPPPEPKVSEGGAQLKKIERNGKTALLVAGYGSSVNDSVMEKMKDEMENWDPNDTQLNMPIKTLEVPLGLGVFSIDGDVDIKRPGSNFWEPLRKGTAIPEGSRVFTGIDGNVWIYGKFGIANISHGSYVTITKDAASQGNDPNVRFDIQVGKVEIRYEKANYQGIIQTRTPSAMAQVKGTRFYTSYNQEQRYSAVGVYEGQVEVQSLTTGEKIEISSDNNRKQDLVFLPLQQPKEENKQSDAVAKQDNQIQKSNTGIFVLVVVVLGLIAAVVILYRKGRLMLLYRISIQKISEMMKKTSKNNKKQETD